MVFLCVIFVFFLYVCSVSGDSACFFLWLLGYSFLFVCLFVCMYVCLFVGLFVGSLVGWSCLGHWFFLF